MDLPKIDLRALQPAQRSVDRRREIGRALVIGQRRANPAFGGENHPAAQCRLRRQDLAKQGFGIPETLLAVEAIDIGGIEQIDARLQHGMDQPGGSGNTRPPSARRHIPQAIGENGGAIGPEQAWLRAGAYLVH